MKILFASTVFPHARDVIRGTYNRELTAALATGHDVRVVAPVGWADAIRTLDRRTPDDAEGLAIARPAFWYLPRVRPRSLGRRLVAAMRRGTRRIGHAWTPELVLSYWLYPDAWAAQRLADDFGARHLTIVGGSDVLKLPHEAERGTLVREVLGRCDLAVAVSQQLVDAIAAVSPETPAAVWSQGIRTSVLHDGPQIDARGRLGLPDVPTYLWVGRMVPVKALPRLIDAFAAVAAAQPCQLVMVGNGPSQEPTERLVAERGLTDRVRFVGPVAPADLGDYYRACDATVLSSDSEGLPNVLRESLACGRPFASSLVGGVGEIGHDDCRTLAPPGDAAGLAEAMRRVLDPKYRQAAAARPVRTWQIAASDLVDLAGLAATPLTVP